MAGEMEPTASGYSVGEASWLGDWLGVKYSDLEGDSEAYIEEGVV